MGSITINDKPHELADGATVAHVLRQVNVTQRYVAVALNGTVVPRAEHSSRKLRAGDRLEIVHPAGGGL